MKRGFGKFLTFLCGALLTISLSSCSLLSSLLEDLNDLQNASNGVTHLTSGEGWAFHDELLPVSLAKMGESSYTALLPSQGDVNVLVLPIEFTDQPFDASFVRDLDNALNGNGAADTGYWESVASFYEKSSFGNVHLHFEIASTYDSGLTQHQAYNQYNVGASSDNGTGLIRAAFAQYKDAKNLTDPDYIKEHFDLDHNGWVDGIIAVYSGKDLHSGELSYDTNDYFWAYTYWAVAMDSATLTWTAPNLHSPNPNLYFWLSYDFIYEAVSSPKVDAHTLIHETGHMFGLDDYYPDQDSEFNAAGCWSMMDQNILDHDVFSKLILGWANPIVIHDTGTIRINPSSSSGDCLIFPTDSWNGTAYDEYILVEFYTPTDLNYLDSHSRYPNRSLGYSESGVKIYHVDARLVRNDKTRPTMVYQYVDDPSSIGELSYDSRYGYSIAASNCHKSGSKANVNYSLLHLMESDAVNTFKHGGSGTNFTLFKASAFRNKFSMDRFGYSFFPNQDRFNNGDTFDYTITITEIATNYAEISFIKS